MKGRTNGHLLYCEVVHKIRGRVRIKSKALKYLGKLKNEVEKQLEQERIFLRDQNTKTFFCFRTEFGFF